MSFTCNKCPMRATCNTPCAAVESLLPAEERGKIHRLRRRRAYPKAEKLIEAMDDARFLVENRHRLHGRLRLVFDLVYNDNLSHAQIAKLLGMHRRSVGHVLKRAKFMIVRLARRA